MKFAKAKELVPVVMAPHLLRGIAGASADERTNSLIVRGTEGAIKELKGLCERLDVAVGD